MSGYSKTAGGFIVALFVAIAFTGAASPTPIGIKSDCMDGIDQDNDGRIDERDTHCWEYPFDDGGGESQTTSGPNGKMFASDSYEMSVFDWHNQVEPSAFNQGGVACFGPQYEPVYTGIDSISNGKDPSLTQFFDWRNQNCN